MDLLWIYYGLNMGLVWVLYGLGLSICIKLLIIQYEFNGRKR
jgi:hypothetical protein